MSSNIITNENFKTDNMQHANHIEKTLSFDSSIDIKDLMQWEFGRYHHKTFTYSIMDGAVKVAGLEYLVNWLEFLLEKESI